MRPRGVRAVAAVLAGTLGACGALPRVGSDYAGPPATRSLSAAESADAARADARWQARLPHGGRADDLVGWWAQFEDPALDAFQAAAQRESGSLAQAAARISQARATAIAAQAAGLPTLDANALASRGTVAVGTTLRVATQTGATAQAGWEIDLFGRIAREREGADARLAARDAEWHDARVSVAAEVAAQYLQHRYCEALQAIVQADAASRAETARIGTAAAAAGFQAPAAAALARGSAAEAANRLIAQRAECEVSVKALVALTGLSEAEVRERLAGTAGRLPEPRAFAVTSVPADLLAQRPDLAAAERELAAASADVGVADGDRYPRLSLAGSIGPLRLETGGGSATLTPWSIGPSVTVPLFDGGRRAAVSQAARDAYRAAEARYRAQARQAVREVEEALVRLAAANDRDADARAAAQGYREAFAAAQARWRTGLGSLIELEESRRLALSADSTLAAVQRDRVAAWVSLYRALGGGWTPQTRMSR